MDGIKSLCNSTVFIGAFPSYNEMCRKAEKENGYTAMVKTSGRHYFCDGKRWRLYLKPGMPKIMFSNKYGLHSEVLLGNKDMTRRAIPDKLLLDAQVYSGGGISKRDEYLMKHSRYHVGDTVAIAQSYESIVNADPNNDYANYYINQFRYTKGWKNKMYVKGELMPYRIFIKNIRIEHLQDISNEDCLREGVQVNKHGAYWLIGPANLFGGKVFTTPRFAFATLIDKLAGKGAWEENPLVFVYEFQLVI